MKITAESLRKDRERREDEREQIALDYETAATALLALDERDGFDAKELLSFRRASNHLRGEAESWRRR